MKRILILAVFVLVSFWLYSQNIFQKITITDTLSQAPSLAIIDFNYDSLPDVIVNDKYNNRILLYKQMEDQSFEDTVLLNVSYPQCVAAYDFNNDTAIDVAYFKESNFYVYFNDGNNNFTGSTQLSDGYVKKLALIDYNKDSLMDLIGIAYFSYDKFVHIYKNNDGSSFSVIDPGNNGDGVNDVFVADFDKDGYDDFVIATQNNVIIYQNNSGSSFTRHTIATLPYPYSVDAIDFNNDSLPEIVVYTSDENYDRGWILIYENNGNFNFTQVYNSGDVSAYNGYAKAGDFNNDGLVDIAFSSNNNQDFQWLENIGNYNFAQHFLYGGIGGSPGLYRCDVNQDSLLDILGTYDQKVYWFKNIQILQTSLFGSDTTVCAESEIELIIKVYNHDSIAWYAIYNNETVPLTEGVDGFNVHNDTAIFIKHILPDTAFVFAKIMNQFDTVYSDTIRISNEKNPPVLITKTDTLYFNDNGFAIIDKNKLIDTVFDNCQIIDTIFSADTLFWDNSGKKVYTVSITVKDISQNTTTRQTTVTVLDTIKPVINCLDNASFDAGENDFYIVQGNELDPQVSDNCEIASITNNLNNDNTLANYQLPVGITEIIWTATDVEGNSASCKTIVDVKQTTALKKADLIKIYPNPAEDFVYINSKTTGEINLIDFQGKILFNGKLKTGTQKIKLNGLQAGIYFLKIKTQKEAEIYKIIKK